MVISNSSSVGQTSLTLSSSYIQLNEYYEAIVSVKGSTFLHHFEISMYVCMYYNAAAVSAKCTCVHVHMLEIAVH